MGNSLVKRPWLSERSDQVWPRLGQLVVDGPAARQVALAALGRGLQREQRDDVARVRVEDLLLRRVRGGADAVRVELLGQVLDVGEGDVGRSALVGAVLAAADRGHVGGEADVDDDVLLARVAVDGDAPDDLEAVAAVELARDGAEGGVQGAEGECLPADLPQVLAGFWVRSC